MAQGVNRDAASEVHQFSTALIPYSRAQTTHRHEGGGGESGNNDLVEIGAFYRGVRADIGSPARRH